ncbi:MAG: murein biosynthesis integral membrane protein MurJ [Acidimicrobiales bacterium]|jgi:putative peptidoglycan lipid II flippase|nr:murein biosynthesis integral membrane protein MurJ [Acidimicrobiales bacterium]
MAPDRNDASNRPGGRGSSAVAAGIALSRLSGLLRESLLRSVLALGPAADAFAAALRIPNLLQNLLGEGSLSASFIPVYSRLLGEGRDDEAGRVAGAVAGLLAALAGGLVVVSILAARPLAVLLAPGFEGRRLDLTVDLLRITTGGLGLLVLSAWCLGVLNSHGRFFLPYVAPVLWNAAQVMILAVAAFGDWSPRGAAIALAWGLVAGGALQFGVQAVAVWRLAPDLRPSFGRGNAAVADVRRRFGPAVLGRGVLQLSGYLDLVLASLLVTGAVAGLLSAQMLYALPVALFATSVAVAELPEMSRLASGLADRALAARRRTAFFVAFCTVAYLVLGESIVGALFGWGAFDADDTRAVALVLAAYSLGLPAVASSKIFQNTLYAVGDTSGPARIAAARVGLAAVVGIALMFPLDRIAAHGGALLTLDGVGWFGPLNAGIRTGSPDPHLGAVGLALGSACAAWLELALLSRRCRRSVDGTSGPTAVMSRLAPATGAAVVVALGVRWATDGLPAIAAAPIGLAVAGCTYVLVASATGVDEANLVIGPLRRRLRR